jgi:hypothetical protein
MQGAFRDLGLRSTWSAFHGSGNPCDAAEVSRHVAMVEREQCAAGVRPVQAALCDQAVFDKIMNVTLEEWVRYCSAASEEDLVRAATAAQDALHNAVLWNAGLRATDAVRLRAAQLTLASDTDGDGRVVNKAYLDFTFGKSVQKAKKAYRVSIYNNERFPSRQSTSCSPRTLKR